MFSRLGRVPSSVLSPWHRTGSNVWGISHSRARRATRFTSTRHRTAPGVRVSERRSKPAGFTRGEARTSSPLVFPAYLLAAGAALPSRRSKLDTTGAPPVRGTAARFVRRGAYLGERAHPPCPHLLRQSAGLDRGARSVANMGCAACPVAWIPRLSFFWLTCHVLLTTHAGDQDSSWSRRGCSQHDDLLPVSFPALRNPFYASFSVWSPAGFNPT